MLCLVVVTLAPFIASLVYLQIKTIHVFVTKDIQYIGKLIRIVFCSLVCVKGK